MSERESWTSILTLLCSAQAIQCKILEQTQVESNRRRRRTMSMDWYLAVGGPGTTGCQCQSRKTGSLGISALSEEGLGGGSSRARLPQWCSATTCGMGGRICAGQRLVQ